MTLIRRILINLIIDFLWSCENRLSKLNIDKVLGSHKNSKYVNLVVSNNNNGSESVMNFIAQLLNN